MIVFAFLEAETVTVFLPLKFAFLAYSITYPSAPSTLFQLTFTDFLTPLTAFTFTFLAANSVLVSWLSRRFCIACTSSNCFCASALFSSASFWAFARISSAFFCASSAAFAAASAFAWAAFAASALAFAAPAAASARPFCALTESLAASAAFAAVSASFFAFSAVVLATSAAVFAASASFA